MSRSNRWSALALAVYTLLVIVAAVRLCTNELPIYDEAHRFEIANRAREYDSSATSLCAASASTAIVAWIGAFRTRRAVTAGAIAWSVVTPIIAIVLLWVFGSAACGAGV